MELRASEAAELAARFGAAAAHHFTLPRTHARPSRSALLRSILGMLWRTSAAPSIGSSRYPPTRGATRTSPFLRLIPWLLVAFAWIGLTLASIIAYYATVLPVRSRPGRP